MPELLNFAKTLNNEDVKKVVLITSCFTKKIPQKHLREILALNEIFVFQAEFICQGGFLLAGMGHPNKEEIHQAQIFAKNIYEDVKEEFQQ
ncbi:MAG: hypothetical protein RSA79_01140 [Oscillospiraceae bacterium]